MKMKLLCILLSLAGAAQAAGPLAPLPQQAQAAHLSAQFLTRFHYKPVPLDDAMSARILERYLKSLDPDRYVFVQADIDQFASARGALDDAIYQEDLHIPFAIFNAYQRRLVERLNYARALLREDFDFSARESYAANRDKEPWPATEADNRELWRKRVKNDWLRLKLAGQPAPAIRATLTKRYDNALARADKHSGADVFQLFMNAYASAIEPHTDYLGANAAADFDIAMKLSLVGIGAVLQERDDFTTIRELVPGGPAAQSGKLKVGDRIVGVGQGAESAPTDVVGWRIDDVVALIRGAKDSVVRLDVLPADAGPDGQHQYISLLRNKISLDQQAAKKSIVAVGGDAGGGARKVGVISLPTFYQDVEARQSGDNNFRSATRDVARLVDELKRDKVDSLLLDLRNNGGGSLSEAVDLTGLFIGSGPVVQQRNARGEVKVSAAANPAPAWNGPFGVLINRASASASEIVAAAIQDHGRGVVIGDASYGKGTVQTLVDLDQLARNDKPLFGELKVTIAQFFRIDGGTTQLRGVVPDIGLPALIDADSVGESGFDNALPWSRIAAADYTPSGAVAAVLPALQSRHAARVAQDRDFQYLLQDVAEAGARRKSNRVSLNETERAAEREQREAQLKSRQRGDAAAPARADDGLQAGERKLSAELDAEHAQKDAKDVLLAEAARILDDEAALLAAGPASAQRQPGAAPAIPSNIK